MSADAQKVREIHTTWIQAVNAGQLSELLALMTDDAVFINPGEEPIGREGLASTFSAAHRQMRILCMSDLEEVVVAGEVAYTRSRDALSLAPRAGGDEIRLAGYRMTVYRRQPDGRWLLARDIHTLAPVTAAKAAQDRAPAEA